MTTPRYGSPATASPTQTVGVACGTRRSCDTSDIAWSPDSRHLTYVVTDEKGQGQIAVLTMRDRGALTIVDLTHARAGLDAALVTRRQAHRIPLFARRTGSAEPAEPADSRRGRGRRQDLRTAPGGDPPAGGAIKLLGAPDLNVYEYDWSPDGTKFAATAAHGNGDANWWVAELYTIDATSGTANSIHKPALQIASPRWSADGQRIAYIGGLMSDEGITGGDVYVVAATGGDATDVTPDLKASVSTIAWNGSATTILATELAGDRTVIASIDTATKTQRQLWTGQELIYARGFAGLAPGDLGVSVTRDGKRAATIRQSITKPPEIALGPLGAMHDITSANKTRQAPHRHRAQLDLDQRRHVRPRLADLSARHEGRGEVSHRHDRARRTCVRALSGVSRTARRRSKPCSPRAATSCSSRTPAAATAKAKRSRAPT